MENPCSDPARGSSISRGCGEFSAAADGKGMCMEAASGSKQQKTKGRDVAGVETTNAWTGEKKAKIQITPISSDPSKTEEDDSEHSDNIIHATNQEEQGPEQIEGLDWDDTMLKNEMDMFVSHYTGLPDRDDDEFWVSYDEEQQAELNMRLALYRLRAHEISKGAEVKDLDDKELRRMYPESTLIKMGYLYRFEYKFEWYFDHEYCRYAKLQDYQRLVLRKNDDYPDWEYYRRTCSSLQSDQEFVQFWEKLSSKTKWIENFLDAGWQEREKMERVVFYHCVKIAAEFPNIYSNLFYDVVTDYMWGVRFDNSLYKNYAGLYLEIWKLVAKQKMSFKEALERLKDKAMQACLLELKAELESDPRWPGPMTRHYETYMAHIDEKVSEGEAYQFIKEAVKEFVPKRKTYYDYAKRKLGIAEKIGLI